MYNEHFGLDQPPFRITPDTRLFYTGGGRGDILDALVYAITSGEGIIKVTGEVGTGKTMLCRMLESRLPDNVDLVYLANPSLTPDDIVQAIALELGALPEGEHTRIEMVFQLQQTLLQRHAANHRVVVLVEEAQSMPTETLEEIRLLSNLETKQEKLLQIVLFGQPELDANLAQPGIRQLRERITHSFQLTPLAPGEIRDYLNFRLRSSGHRGRDVFAADACRAIARASEGLTRRVNILADKAMLAAFAEDTHDVARRHVQVAIKDSEFAPNRRFQPRPWLAVAATALLAAGLGFFGARWLAPSESSSEPRLAVAPGDASAGGRGEAAIRSANASATPAAGTASSTTLAATIEAASTGVDPAAASASVEPRSETAAALTTGVKMQPANADSGAADAAVVAAAVAAASSVTLEPEQAAARAAEPAPPAAEVASAASAAAAPQEKAGTASVPADPGPGSAVAAVTPGIGSSQAARSEANEPAAIEAPTMLAASAPAAPLPQPEGDLLDQRLAATQAWLGVSDPQHYTIQLLATVAANRKSLVRFLERQDQRGVVGDMYVYQTMIGGRSWFSVVFGSFGSYSAARSGLRSLPSDLTNQGPFIRNISDLRIGS